MPWGVSSVPQGFFSTPGIPEKAMAISTPRQDMCDIQAQLDAEHARRKSLRISAKPEYYAGQKEYLEQQIAVFQEKLDILTTRHENAGKELEASRCREATLRKKYAKIKHREKLTRLDSLRKQIEEMAGTL